MDKILQEIQSKIQTAIRDNMPEISADELEEGGKVYYMNGKNGTEFDWFVNEHLPSFMVFYDDEENLGAAKASVYTDGGMIIYLFDDHGRNMKKEVKTFLDISEAEILRLAAYLRLAGDEKKVWDAALDRLDDITVDEAAVSEFMELKKYCEPSIRRKELMGKFCVVSKKVTREGWKVGFMLREDPADDEDSGWQLFAGDEDDEYTNNIDNVELCPLYSITGIDPALMGYIESPAGTSLVRVSSDKFEADKGQPVFMEKWK
ncbi:MAG: DUF2185 domain-containing protein [Oscillospiraceae bacterium]|nr:DUF2185 domain-containing protein [Oscillospiraceae bacterium]